MNRQERRQEEREIQHKKKLINKLTPAQAQMINDLAKKRALELAEEGLKVVNDIVLKCQVDAMLEHGIDYETIDSILCATVELMDYEGGYGKMENFIPGEKYNVRRSVRKGAPKREELTFEAETSHSFRFTNGRYQVTINKTELKTGEVKIVSKIEEEKAMKIDEKELIKDIREFGLETEGREKICKKYGINRHGLSCKLSIMRKEGKLKEFEAAEPKQDIKNAAVVESKSEVINVVSNEIAKEEEKEQLQRDGQALEEVTTKATPVENKKYLQVAETKIVLTGISHSYTITNEQLAIKVDNEVTNIASEEEYNEYIDDLTNQFSTMLGEAIEAFQLFLQHKKSA